MLAGFDSNAILSTPSVVPFSTLPIVTIITTAPPVPGVFTATIPLPTTHVNTNSPQTLLQPAVPIKLSPGFAINIFAQG